MSFHLFSSNTKRSLAHKTAGFSLTELLVVIAIIGVITTVGIFGFRGNDYQINLDAAAHLIDITLRQAQVYATSVREYTIYPSTKTFDAAYGVYFSSGSNSDGFIFFAKPATGVDAVTGNPTYTSKVFVGNKGACNASDNCIQRQTFKSGFTIKSIKVSLNSVSTDCTAPSAACTNATGNELSVLYMKTNLGLTLTDGSISLYKYAEIRIESPTGTPRIIQISSNGSTNIK